jgi:hypothetical protein
MHERYLYGAVIFMAAVTSERVRAATWAVLAGVATANVVAAIPPANVPGSLIPLGGVVGIAGSVVILSVGAALIAELRRRETASVSDPRTAGGGT